MTAVTRWKFDNGGTYSYTFERNPDRQGGDSFWVYSPRLAEVDIIGANSPHIQIDGFGARRTIKFTAITGNMMRNLQSFFLRKQIIQNCTDHLTASPFSCFIISFTSTVHPTSGAFPGSGEDTYDVEMQIVMMG